MGLFSSFYRTTKPYPTSIKTNMFMTLTRSSEWLVITKYVCTIKHFFFRVQHLAMPGNDGLGDCARQGAEEAETLL